MIGGIKVKFNEDIVDESSAGCCRWRLCSMRRRKKRRTSMSSISNGEKVPLARGRNTSKKRKNVAFEVPVEIPVAVEMTNEEEPSGSTETRVLRMKEGPPTASAVASSLIIANPTAMDIEDVGDQGEGEEAVVGAKSSAMAMTATTSSTTTVMATKISDGKAYFQSTDTVKRLKKLCRDFYREATDALLFINQQAFSDKDRWSNEPPYVVLCQNAVGRCVKEIDDRVCILAEKVEKLESELSTLVIPINKMVLANPHPFDGHSQRRVVNALERWRLVHNESFFKFHFTCEEFAQVSNDLAEKNKQLEAKLRHESKKATGTSRAITSSEGNPASTVLALPVPKASDAAKTKVTTCWTYPEYIVKVLQLLARVGKFGDSFRSFELSQFSKLKGLLEERHGEKWMGRFESFLQDAYKSYQSIFGSKTSFACKNAEEDSKQHMATFRFCFQSKFGDDALL